MVTHSWMEVLTPTAPCFPNSSWLPGSRRSGNWTQEENKCFEDALAQFDRDTPDRWAKVAAMIPGKSVGDIISHYRDLEDDVSHIEAGLIPFPGYISSSFTLDWKNSHGYEGLLKPAYCVGGKRSAGRPDQERKKGVPWTEEEHKLFLLGLQKYGKGDWRNISRNFVITRTPTQVASHAQKYFIRLHSGGKDKRRSSIHDITTVNLPNNGPLSPSQTSTLQSGSAAATAGITGQFSVMADSNQPSEAAGVFSPSAHGNPFMQPPFEITSYGMKLAAQHSQRGSLQDSVIGDRNMLFQMHPHG